MEIKSMSASSNTAFEKSNALMNNSRPNPTKDSSKVVDKIEKTQSLKDEDQSSKEEVSSLTNKENRTKTFDYDAEAEVFMIIVKNDNGETQQYPTEELLKFKKMINEEFRQRIEKQLLK